MRDWPADLPSDSRYKACAIESEIATTLPPAESAAIEDLHFTDEQEDAYMDLLESLSGDDAWASRGLLGGYPDQIQGDMTVECALVSGGLYCGDASGYEDPRAPQLRSTAHEWRLLLQVPSVEETGMMWGDAGCLYYWIREEDLRDKKFDRSWMILQCG